MDLSDYFENVQGLGILATADAEGKVGLAIYAGPQVIDETTGTFVMGEKLSHQNIESNPNAACIFVEQGEGYIGKGLYLSETSEETDIVIIESMRKINRKYSHNNWHKKQGQGI